MRGRLLARIPRYPDLEDVGRAIIITNSERNTAACPLRHWYSQVLGLEPIRETVNAASFGQAFHAVQESVWRSVMATDRPPADEVFEAALCEVVDGWRGAVSEVFTPADLGESEARIRGVVEAWRHGFDFGSFLAEFEVAGVERAFVTPIVDPETGSPLRASMRVVEDVDENGAEVIRLARPGDEGWRRVQWPWYFAGRVDLLVRSRLTGVVWIVDHKTTTSPNGLASILMTDPQSPSYAWLIANALGERVAGFMWNIVDSSPPGEPRVLKNGDLSLAQRQKVPSWRIESYLAERGREAESALPDLRAAVADDLADLRASLRDAETRLADLSQRPTGDDLADNASEIAKLEREIGQIRKKTEKLLAPIDAVERRVEPSEEERQFVEEQRIRIDPRWAVVEQHAISLDDLRMAGAEIHADAIRLARLYRDGLTDDRLALARTHPRVPVCRAPGAFCSYRGPCTSDGPVARAQFTVRAARSWVGAKQSSSTGSTSPVEETSTTPTNSGDFEW